jgi:hypothetical protein
VRPEKGSVRDIPKREIPAAVETASDKVIQRYQELVHSYYEALSKQEPNQEKVGN